MTDLVDQLREAVGSKSVFDPADLPSATTDVRGIYQGAAVSIVRPATTDEVAAVVRVCSDHGAAIVTQGGNTGRSGGSVPVDDEFGRPTVIVLLDRMNKIEAISPDGFWATVEAGVTVEELQTAASTAGLMFAPDWGARGTATIGGAVSTNAGGINVLAFGPIRDHILGLEVVFPDGRTWDGLRALRKDSSGYDIKQLIIGSEGTLGIVTRVTVKLLPAISHESTAMAAIVSISDLAEITKLARSGTNGTLTALELMPEIGVAAVVDKFGWPRPLDTRADWYLLIRYGGSDPVGNDLAEFLQRAVDGGLLTDAVIADSRRQEENLWLLRDEMAPPGLMPHHKLALKMDAAVPIDRVADYIGAVEATCRDLAPSAAPYMFGHVGDGNIHIYVLPIDSDIDAFLDIKPALIRALDQHTWDMGGTISAEHGIGQELVDRIVGQKPAIEFEMMRNIKRLFDPDNLLNPGKTIPRLPAP